MGMGEAVLGALMGSRGFSLDQLIKPIRGVADVLWGRWT